MDMRGRARAAVLVAVLVAAGLGACGDGSSPGSGGEDADGRPLLPIGATGSGGGTSEAMAATGAEDSAARSLIAPAAPVQYQLADGAKAPATSATAYRVVPASGDLAGRVGKALGVSSDDGHVEVVSGAGWYYSRDPDGAVSSETVASSPACAPDESGTGDLKCEPPPMPEPPPGVPSADEAEARFRTILTALEVDVSAGSISVSGDDDPYQRQVSFAHTVDGVEVSGLETAVSFGEEGRIEFAGGFLGSFESVGDYPLGGLDEALRRFQEGFGGGGFGVGGAEPGIAVDTPAVAEAETREVEARKAEGSGGGTSGSTGSAGAAEPAEPAPDPAVSGPAVGEPVPDAVPPPDPVVVEVTGAEVVLEVVLPRCEDETIYLVPAFRLLPEDQLGMTVTAVEEDSTTAAASDGDAAGDDGELEPCPGEEPAEDPVGRPEPAPLPPDADRGAIEPADPANP